MISQPWRKTHKNHPVVQNTKAKLEQHNRNTHDECVRKQSEQTRSHLPHIHQFVAAACRLCHFQVNIFHHAERPMPLDFNDAEHFDTIAATKPPRCGRRLQPVPSGQVYVEAFTMLTLARRRCCLPHKLFRTSRAQTWHSSQKNSYVVECEHSCALNNSSQKSAAPFRWTTTWVSRRNVQCTNLGRALQKDEFPRSCGRKKIHKQHPAQFVSQARVVDVILYLICAQGRVARQKARTRHTVEVDGIGSEADRFNWYSVCWFMKGPAQLLQSKYDLSKPFDTLLKRRNGTFVVQSKHHPSEA